MDADTIDERIRRRFRACETLPLFPEPLPPGFFQPSDIGHQLSLHDVRPPQRDQPDLNAFADPDIVDERRPSTQVD